MKFPLIIRLFILFASLIQTSQLYSKEFNLAVTAIFRDEAPYLREWIEYHQLIGVEHFYLYNHLSIDHYEEVLAEYIKNGSVELIQWEKPASNWEEWDKIQIAAYRDAVKRSKNKTRWLAILDIDEFVVPSEDNLRTLLKRYENEKLGGICAMWSFFGTSHVEKIPEGKLMIETLIHHTGPAANGEISNVWNQGAFKSIIRPEFVTEVVSPHYCHYKKGREHKMVSYKRLHINHYWTRDNDFLMNVKIPRREVWNQDKESVIAWAQGMNGGTENNGILRFVAKLKERMGLD